MIVFIVIDRKKGEERERVIEWERQKQGERERKRKQEAKKMRIAKAEIRRMRKCAQCRSIRIRKKNIGDSATRSEQPNIQAHIISFFPIISKYFIRFGLLRRWELVWLCHTTIALRLNERANELLISISMPVYTCVRVYSCFTMPEKLFIVHAHFSSTAKLYGAAIKRTVDIWAMTPFRLPLFRPNSNASIRNTFINTHARRPYVCMSALFFHVSRLSKRPL